MQIEIYADNLIKKDVIKNPMREYLSVLIQIDGKILFRKELAFDTYTLPYLESGAGSVEALVAAISDHEAKAITEKLTICEYLPGLTNKIRYFLVDLETEAKKLKPDFLWMDSLEALSFLEDNIPSNERGYQLQTREFIALTNLL